MSYQFKDENYYTFLEYVKENPEKIPFEDYKLNLDECIAEFNELQTKIENDNNDRIEFINSNNMNDYSKLVEAHNMQSLILADVAKLTALEETIELLRAIIKLKP